MVENVVTCFLGGHGVTVFCASTNLLYVANSS